MLDVALYMGYLECRYRKDSAYFFLLFRDSTLPWTLRLPTLKLGVVSSRVTSKLNARSCPEIFSRTSAMDICAGSLFDGIMTGCSRTFLVYKTYVHTSRTIPTYSGSTQAS